MPTVQETTTITVDGAVFAVEKMSPGVKQLIAFMDAWRQKEVDSTVELTMIKAALRDIQNNIYGAINKEKQDTLAKAADLGLTPGAEATPVDPSASLDTADPADLAGEEKLEAEVKVVDIVEAGSSKKRKNK